MCMGCCGIGWGCSARHEGLVVPARLVESAVGICAEMSVVVLHDPLVGVPVGVGCSRPSGQQQQQAKAKHVGGEDVASRSWTKVCRVVSALSVVFRVT